MIYFCGTAYACHELVVREWSDPNLTGEDGETPLGSAGDTSKDIFLRLIELGAKYDWVWQRGNHLQIRWLVEKFPDKISHVDFASLLNHWSAPSPISFKKTWMFIERIDTTVGAHFKLLLAPLAQFSSNALAVLHVQNVISREDLLEQLIEIDGNLESVNMCWRPWTHWYFSRLQRFPSFNQHIFAALQALKSLPGNLRKKIMIEVFGRVQSSSLN